MKKTIILICSIILLLASAGIFVYLKMQNNDLDKELSTLNAKKEEVTEKINNSKEQVKEKENEYEKLKVELKEKVEELEVWKKLEEKLNTALSS